MSANNNNKRIRRALLQILWENGPCTRQEVVTHLQELKSVKTTPSPNSLSALLSKNPQVISVGKTKVEMTNGTNANHMLFDIDRRIIHEFDELIYTRPGSVMTPNETRRAKKCTGCGRNRIMPPEGQPRLTCQRTALYSAEDEGEL